MTMPAETRRWVLLVVFVLLVVVGAPVLASGIPDWRAGSDPTTSYLLRYTSVHVAPGAEGVLDADRARRIIGDRPIVVVVEPEDGCEDIGDALPGLIVLEVSRDPDQPLFPCSRATSGYAEAELLADTRDAVSVRHVGRELIGYVEEFVHAFDAHIDAAAPGAPPPRREPPPPVESGALNRHELTFLIALGVYVAVLAIISGYLIRYSRLDKRASAVRARDWQARNDARLNRLADRVLRVDEPDRTADERAAAAKRYVLALQDFEAAVTDEQRAAVDAQLTELEQQSDVSQRRGSASVERKRARIAAREKAVAERRAAKQRAAEQEALQREAEREAIAKWRAEEPKRAAKARGIRRKKRGRRR